jgi:hypothetical protein
MIACFQAVSSLCIQWKGTEEFMTEQKTVGQSVTEMIEAPIGMITGLVDGLIRNALGIVSIPMNVLPEDARQKARMAVCEAATAVLAIPKEASKWGENAIDQIYGSDEPTIELPRVEEIAERAREFTDRIARATQEVGNAVTSTANAVADSVAPAAAGSTGGTATSAPAATGSKSKDQWVEKKK